MTENGKLKKDKKSILKGIHRVLKYREVQDPVKVNLGNETYCWKCKTNSEGKTICGWVKC